MPLRALEAGEQAAATLEYHPGNDHGVVVTGVCVQQQGCSRVVHRHGIDVIEAYQNDIRLQADSQASSASAQAEGRGASIRRRARK